MACYSIQNNPLIIARLNFFVGGGGGGWKGKGRKTGV